MLAISLTLITMLEGSFVQFPCSAGKKWGLREAGQLVQDTQPIESSRFEPGSG